MARYLSDLEERELHERLARIEAMLVELVERLGVTLPPPEQPERPRHLRLVAEDE